MRGGLAAAASGILLSACSVVGIRTVEEPAYQVVRHVGAVEIRAYGPRLAAEVVVPGTEVDARGAGFRKIAAYIFGANTARTTIAMTAPVSQAAESPAESTTIAMTAPVAQAAAPGGWRIRFFMPASYTRATLPRPNDPDVTIVAVPGEQVAVLRYSGIPGKAAVAEADAKLLATLAQAGITPVGAPFSWFYDPPWTLPPLRRNEAVVAVKLAS